MTHHLRMRRLTTIRKSQIYGLDTDHIHLQIVVSPKGHNVRIWNAETGREWTEATDE